MLVSTIPIATTRSNKVRYRFMSICPYVLRGIERNLPEHENADRRGLQGIKSARSCERKCPDALLYRKSLSRIAGATLTTGVAHCQDKMNMFTYWIEVEPM